MRAGVMPTARGRGLVFLKSIEVVVRAYVLVWHAAVSPYMHCGPRTSDACCGNGDGTDRKQRERRQQLCGQQLLQLAFGRGADCEPRCTWALALALLGLVPGALPPRVAAVEAAGVYIGHGHGPACGRGCARHCACGCELGCGRCADGCDRNCGRGYSYRRGCGCVWLQAWISMRTCVHALLVFLQMRLRTLPGTLPRTWQLVWSRTRLTRTRLRA